MLFLSEIWSTEKRLQKISLLYSQKLKENKALGSDNNANSYFMTGESRKENSEVWLIDSGASSHIAVKREF